MVTPADAARDIPDDNLAYPVLLQGQTPQGKISTGSGFYLVRENEVFLVTASHVIFEQLIDGLTKQTKWNLRFENPISALSYSKDPEETIFNVFSLDLKMLGAFGNLKKHASQDVAVIRIGNINNDGILVGLPGADIKQSTKGGILGAGIGSVKTFDKVLTANEVFLFGYPTSLGLLKLDQYDYSKPLLRKGIVAGKNDIAKTLMLDLLANPGNSGGPVLEVEALDFFQMKYSIIGVQSQFVPMTETVMKYGLPMEVLSHSGYSLAVSMDPVLELIASFTKIQSEGAVGTLPR